MAVPAPTFEDTNFNTATWIKSGSPLLASDQFGTDNTFALDGNNDLITYTGSEFILTGVAHTISGWFLTTDAGGNDMWNERGGISGGGFFTRTTLGGLLLIQFENTLVTTPFTRITSVSSVVGGTWNHYSCAVNGTSIRLVLNGVDEGTVLLSGGGYTTPGTEGFPMIFGNNNPGSGAWAGTPSKPKLWATTELNLAEQQEEHANEVALIPSPGGTPRSRLITILGAGAARSA